MRGDGAAGVGPGRDVAAAPRSFCRANLAQFKVPRALVFGALPKTATGTIRKFVLRETARGMAETAGVASQ